MQTIKDLFSGIRDRISSPLIFSFAAAWLIVNWRISVALLWYDTEQIKESGANTIYDFVSNELQCGSRTVVWPIALALFYTFVLPIIRIAIEAYLSRIRRLGDDWITIINKGSRIPIEKYMRLRENFLERTKWLEKMIEEEGTTIEVNTKLQDEIINVSNENNQLKKQINELNRKKEMMYDVSFLNGYWLNEFMFPNENLRRTERVFIQDGLYYELDEKSAQMLKYRVEDFIHDVDKGEITFVKIPEGAIQDQRKYLYNKLSIEGEHLVGQEDLDISNALCY